MDSKEAKKDKLEKTYGYVWDKYTGKELDDLFSFSEGYKEFISRCKTERECVSEFIRLAEEKGYKDLATFIENGEPLKAGDKVYANNSGKTLALFVIGSQPMEKGLRIVGAHVDSPRLDLKQNPLYEDSGLALFKTHYYGGVKKYQWVTIPLAIHGVVIKKDGTVVDVVIGEDESDPVVGITDLLIHLASDQMDKSFPKPLKAKI